MLLLCTPIPGASLGCLLGSLGGLLGVLAKAGAEQTQNEAALATETDRVREDCGWYRGSSLHSHLTKQSASQSCENFLSHPVYIQNTYINVRGRPYY